MLTCRIVHSLGINGSERRASHGQQANPEPCILRYCIKMRIHEYLKQQDSYTWIEGQALLVCSPKG
jgi:hypothetical protein